MPNPTAGSQPAPLLAGRELDLLRRALEQFTADSVLAALGPRGQASLERADLTGASRALRGAPEARLADLTTLLLLGGELDERRATRALAPLPVQDALDAGLIERSGAAIRATVEIRPYAETGTPGSAATPWWVVSDLGTDARPGPLPTHHVLGIGSASLTLAQATPRDEVGRALDIGTGCGVQALHLATHSAQVTATDVSERALRFAATTAALSGQQWELRRGSLLDPVADERFDLVVANPPFGVSAGASGPDHRDSGLDYRDSGLAGDAVCETIVRGLPGLLNPHGTAVLLANWILRGDEQWDERLASWLTGRSCDVWAWQRETASPEEYVSLWLRDAGRTPADEDWTTRYDAWCSWFEEQGVAGVGMGLIALWRTEDEPVAAFDDVRQTLEQPVGPELGAWVTRARWLRDTTDADLLDAALRPVEDLVRSRGDLLDADGWRTARAVLRQSHGLRWEVEVDDPIATLVAGCAADATLGTCLDLLAASLRTGTAELCEAVLPVVRDLVARGFLLPQGG